MQTLMISGKEALMEEIKVLVFEFAQKKGEKVQIKEEYEDNRTTYNSLEELRADYAQRIADIESGKEPIFDLHDGQLDAMMDKIKQKYANKI